MTAMLMKVLAVRAAEVTYPTGDRSFAVLQCFPAAFPPEESDPYVWQHDPTMHLTDLSDLARTPVCEQ